MSTKGKRMFRCADCKNRQFMHPIELARRCKPRCVGCGGTFFEPDSDGAHDMEANVGTARAIQEKAPPNAGTSAAAAMMRGEREIPGKGARHER